MIFRTSTLYVTTNEIKVNWKGTSVAKHCGITLKLYIEFQCGET